MSLSTSPQKTENRRKSLTVKIDPGLYNPAYFDFIDTPTRVQIFFGGASSGKSRFLAQRAVFDLLKGGRNYLIVRKVANTLRKSVFTECLKVIEQYNLRRIFRVNKSELTITCLNGYQSYFVGCDDPEKLKSITFLKGSLTDIWFEEATESIEDDYKMLKKRMRGVAPVRKRFTFSFNPIFRTHWIYKVFFKRIGWADDQKLYHQDGLLILRTTYRDNKFLTPDDREALEEETDEYYRDVYTLGVWGVLGNVIFTDWEVKDILNDPVSKTFDIFRNGLDFGYSNDPTAFNRMYYHKSTRTLYVFNEWHEKGVTNDDIARALKPVTNGDSIVADSAEPKSIKELNLAGLNVHGARKGKDSVNHGIQWLQQQKVVIDKRCIHTVAEFQQYHWKKDREGNTVNIPVDKDNHHIDAIRYGCEDLMFDHEECEIVVGRSKLAAGIN